MLITTLKVFDSPFLPSIPPTHFCCCIFLPGTTYFSTLLSYTSALSFPSISPALLLFSCYFFIPCFFSFSPPTFPSDCHLHQLLLILCGVGKGSWNGEGIIDSCTKWYPTYLGTQRNCIFLEPVLPTTILNNLEKIFCEFACTYHYQ